MEDEEERKLSVSACKMPFQEDRVPSNDFL